MNTKYWHSFADLNNDEAFQKLTENEFREELPFEDTNGKGWLDAEASRRDFLKYLGFSTAAATLSASCKIPVQKAIPFANQPENIIPGEAKYYATTFVQDGDVIPIVAKVRDGRPIKIEGNDLCSFTNGGTSASVQASVLDLYDTYRITHPKRKVADKFEEIPTFEQLDKMVADALAELNGAPVVILTSTVNSATTKQIITEFLSKYPGSRHVQYDAVSNSGMILANEATFAKKTIPSYHFDNAKVIVSLGADFLGTWLSPVEFARQYSKGRKIDEKNPEMSKHYQFESFLSMTGANADERFTHRPSETAAVALALFAALGGPDSYRDWNSAPAINNEKLKKGIEKVAADLKANAGNSLVISGSNDVNVQVIVNAINNLINAYGTTINWATPVNYRQGIDKDMNDLVNQMNAGNVGALLIYGANPAYDFYDAEKFKSAFKKVKLTVSFNEKLDETGELCQFIVPNHHYLESWGDAEPKAGYTSFLQPTIQPLFKTRLFQTSLLKWSGNATAEYETYFKNYWITKLGSEVEFNKVLQDGVRDLGPVPATSGSFNSGPVTAAAAQLSVAKKAGNTELVLYQNVAVGSGKQSGNPWLQELPDPVTKATWDNYAMISLTKAKELLGLDLRKEKAANKYQYRPEKPVIRLTVNNKVIELPVLVIPGMDANTIAVAVGYGRTKGLGKAAEGVGQNVYPFASFNGSTVDYFNTDVVVEKTDKEYKVAQTQIHSSYEGRKEVVKETTLATFKKYPDEFKKERQKISDAYAPKTGDYATEGTLYDAHLYPGLKWGMSIDMNSCISCNACVVACNAENNVPVVGKKEVLRGHEMHWIRIDRYFVTPENNPDDLQAVIFQPMLCQHCDHAPCETVCPVAATTHSSEGLNEMTYNRCIGTKYCAANCPYKVRRFNWADYTGADSFKNNQKFRGVGALDDVVHDMNEDLTRMVLNPDVTVRSRGVMEKCTFCVQRLQAGKLTAKKENRPFKDGDAKTACMTACPTHAIVFGSVHNGESRVSQTRHDNPLRLFHVLEQLHTLPNVSYLAKIRNTDELKVD